MTLEAAKQAGRRAGLWLVGRAYDQYAPRALRLPDRYHRQPPTLDGPTIAIVTPSYQQARFLGSTLESVVSQDYPGLRYFVQDGGSSDGSVGVLQAYADRLAGWVSEPDGGQADAIRRGFEEIEGDVMAWLNSDDLLLSGTLHYVGAYFRDHPEVDVVYGHRVVIDENGDEVGRWALPRHTRGSLAWRNYIPQETMFWRRRIWERVGGIDPSFQFAMDCDLVERFHSHGARFVRLPRFLGAFRTHDEQKSLATRATVGEPEFEIIRSRACGTQGKRLLHRSLSLAHMTTSMAYTGAHRLQLLRH